MRALTVQQPWAWAIVHGGKDIENRTQAWAYRGPLAIHAGSRVSDRGLASPLIAPPHTGRPHVTPATGEARVSWRVGDRKVGLRLPLGAIIGVVDLCDAHQAITCGDDEGAMCSAWAESAYVEHGGRTRREIVHLVLRDPRPTDRPIPCRGRLGLWTPPPDVLDELREVV